MHHLIGLAVLAGTFTAGQKEFPLSEPLCGG